MKHLLTLSLLAILQLGWAQSEYCLDGTVWDAALGGCVPESDCLLASDLDGDGSVGSGDLLSFLSEFGGTFPDADADGVCDDIDECVGEYDDCGVCNGPGAVYECGCEECGLFVECGDPISYQGYDYATVLIGDQCWFAENLRNENYANGDAIPSNLSDDDWINTTFGAAAVFGENDGCNHYSPDIDACEPAQSLDEYGRLYNWYAVDDARGLCPSGWHVPTDGEWMTMEMALGMSEAEANNTGWRGTNQGTQMKTDYGWLNDGNGTNSSGFSGLPGGDRNLNFNFAGSNGYWWSSSSSSGNLSAWNRDLDFGNEGVFRSTDSLRLGCSVRCIRDTE